VTPPNDSNAKATDLDPGSWTESDGGRHDCDAEQQGDMCEAAAWQVKVEDAMREIGRVFEVNRKLVSITQNNCK